MTFAPHVAGALATAARCARWLLAVVLLLFWGVDAESFKQRADRARKKGLTGYDLVDAVDPYFGHSEPDTRGPLRALKRLARTAEKNMKLESWLKVGLPEPHFQYFDADKNGLLDRDEVYTWWMQRKGARVMDLSELDNPPKGHLKRLGSWKDPLPSDDLVYTKPYPHPRDFWRKHMDGYLPAVLKGAQDGWPAMNWTKEVLMERFGWVEAKLEPKLESRNNQTAYADLDKAAPNHRLNISEYLRVEEGKNMYVVSIIPQAMAWEVAHPSVLLCGSRRHIADKRPRNRGSSTKLKEHDYPHEANHEWMTHIFEANLWIASGYTRSQFHFDKEWNVNCLLSGKKRWLFLNSFEADEEIQWARGEKFRSEDPLNNRWTDWVYLDPDKVDLIVQNKLRNLDYIELIQEPGDCIFIPFAMLHQVQKVDTGMQVAASWMFLPETVYDEEACEKAPLQEDLPLAALDNLFAYTGHGLIPQGYSDPLQFRDNLYEVMERQGHKYLSIDLLTMAVTGGDSILQRLGDKKRQKRIRKIYDALLPYAAEPSKGLALSELRNVPLRFWAKPAAEGDEEGPLPCDHGQEYHICDDGEFKKMEATVQEVLARHRPEQARRPESVEPLRHTRSWPRTIWRDRRPSEGRTEL